MREINFPLYFALFQIICILMNLHYVYNVKRILVVFRHIVIIFEKFETNFSV